MSGMVGFKRALCAGILSGAVLALAGPERPNVIIIYGDDVGFGDVGVYGAQHIPTPNIDKLAGEGLRFMDGHCSSATCTPSRYSLLTGNAAFRKDGTAILPGDAQMAISPDQFTLPDLFKKAGYVTGVVGKWHLGLGDGRTPIDWNGEISPGPNDLGFDYSYILPATNDRVPCVYLRNRRIVNLDPSDPIKVDYKNKLTDTYPDAKEHPEAMTVYKSVYGHNFSVINGIGRIGWMSGGRAALWDDETMSDQLVLEAKSFMTRNREKPFFLYYAAQNIHVPRMPHPRFRGKSGLGYRGDSMVEFDWAVGEILNEVEALGLRERTLVIFSSDNGPVYNDGYADGSQVERSFGEVDNGHDGSGVWRGGKYQIYEGGTRVPLIFCWPGVIQPGVTDSLVSQLDFMASFASLFELSLPKNAAFDSRNMLPVFLGAEPPEKGAILVQGGELVGLRQGCWKYVPPRPATKRRAAMPEELYNLSRDPGEADNVAGAFPEKIEEMKVLREKLMAEGIAGKIMQSAP